MSIIIPTYNAAATLGVCLKSVVEQTFRNYEIIVCDGKSGDSTVAIARCFLDSGVQIEVLSEQDDGIYDAMNKGICESKGEWLYFMGADDELLDENVMSSVSQYFDNEYSIVYGNALWTSASKPEFIYDWKFSRGSLLEKNICHQAIFYRRELFIRHGLYEKKYRVFSDWAFNMRVFPQEKSRYVPLTIARFSTDGTSGKTFDHNFAVDRAMLAICYLGPRISNSFYTGHIRSTAIAFWMFMKGRQFKFAATAFAILCWHVPIRLLTMSRAHTKTFL